MASRSHGWFDDAKLLRDERIIRSGRVRLRTSEPPYWWEGSLILTSDRLFFLPYVENPLLEPVAFWLHDVAAVMREGRNIRVEAGAASAMFAVIGVFGRAQHSWLAAIEAVRPDARPRSAFDERRQAAG